MVKDTLKQARIKKNLSQNDVAEKIGLDRESGGQYISNFERGRSNLSPKVLKRYCNLLNESYPAIACTLCEEIAEETFEKMLKKYGI